MPPFSIGGAEIQAQLQAKYLREMGVEVTILARLPRNFKTHSRNFVVDTNVVFFKTPNIRVISGVIFATKLFIWLVGNRARVGLVHVHLANLAADVTALFGRIFNKPVYVKIASGGVTGEIRRFKNVARVSHYFGLRNADRIQAISPEIREELLAIGIAPQRIVSIPNGVEEPDFVELNFNSRHHLRNTLGIDEDCFIFLYLGRKAGYKGIGTLLEAWEMSRLSTDRAALLIVGPKAEDSPIEVNSDPRRGIYSLDATSTPGVYLQNSDVFVLPSFAEGMSNSLLEAISFELPCIASKVGANSELLLHGEGGDLFEAGNVLELSGLLRTAYVRSGDLKAKAKMAKKNLSRYQIQTVVTSILNEYTAIGLE